VYNPPIVPDNFVVPELLETARVRLRPLTIHDAVLDFDAVMSSKRRLQTVFDPGGEWPSGLTLEQNTLELAWHQVEFQLRTSFAYTVVCHDESQVLGCMYIYPTRKLGHDVEITLWVRESEVQGGLDEHLFDAVESWIAEHWPFERPAYPGRKISWESWASGEAT
jgi:RimJ/RimL family protein N-acetyltransferase